MASLRIPSKFRRIGRVALLLALGYPYLIVVVPLFVGMSVHAVNTWMKLDGSHGWLPGERNFGIGFSIAILLFAVLAIVHLAAVIYVGWKGHSAVYRRGSWKAINRPWLHVVINREGLLRRIDAICLTHAVTGPVSREEPACHPAIRYFYQKVGSAKELSLDFTYCVFSLKSTLLPPRETLLEFNRNNGHFEATVTPCAGPYALVGVHPCDIHAIRLLDTVFTREHDDQHYLRRRQNSLVIGIDCATPCSSDAFCCDMQTNSADSGFDVMLYPLIGDSGQGNTSNDFGVVFETEAGRAWLSPEEGAALRATNLDDERRFEQYLERKFWAFSTRLTRRREQLPADIATSYDSLVWEAVAQRCYSCGSCNLVCPTCYCFDLHDDVDLMQQHGSRERVWDGCMLRDFAVVAGGHNFRSKPLERLRHRISRKAAWIEERTGLTGCVGCARCDRACTAHISIVDVLNQLSEESDGATSERSKGRQMAGRKT